MFIHSTIANSGISAVSGFALRQQQWTSAGRDAHTKLLQTLLYYRCIVFLVLRVRFPGGNAETLKGHTTVIKSVKNIGINYVKGTLGNIFMLIY